MKIIKPSPEKHLTFFDFKHFPYSSSKTNLPHWKGDVLKFLHVKILEFILIKNQISINDKMKYPYGTIIQDKFNSYEK